MHDAHPLRPLALLLALCSALALAVAPATAPPAQAIPGHPILFQVLGRATDLVSGKPIDGVQITFTPPDLVLPTLVVTNNGGHYLVERLPAGVTYEVSVAATGYHTLSSDTTGCTDTCSFFTPPLSIPPNPVLPRVLQRNFVLTPL